MIEIATSQTGATMATKLVWNDLELLDKLGEGQAGTVWRARLKTASSGFSAGQIFAIKRFKRWVLEQAGQYDRIYRELTAGTRVSHPHLVKSICLIADHDSLPVLVMRHYEGRTMDSVLKQSRAMARSVDLPTAFRHIGNLASALASLHSNGLIHRDIKPANIIITTDGFPILMDLGVVSADLRAESTLTENFVGSIRYASPEYLFKNSIDKRTDLYSLGAVAYELLIGPSFFAEHNNWAQLIAARAQRVAPLIDYPSLARDLGVAVTDAVRCTLDRLLAPVDERTIDLASVDAAIQARFWEQPFHSSSHGIKLGEPHVAPLGHWDEAHGPRLQLRTIWSTIERLITSEEREWLRPKLEHAYWSGTFKSGAGIIARELSSKGAIRPVKGISMEGGYVWQPHEAILAAFRFGYI